VYNKRYRKLQMELKMFKMDKASITHMTALLQMLCQQQAASDDGATTAQITNWTARSKRWCIELMRHWEREGIVKIVEYRYRNNRTGFRYQVNEQYMNEYKDGKLREGYENYFSELLNHYAEELRKLT